MDINGDGRQDILKEYSGQWYALLSNGAELFTPGPITKYAGLDGKTHTLRYDGDINGDILLPKNGTWHVYKGKSTSQQTFVIYWNGTPINITIPAGGDFDEEDTGIDVYNASTAKLMDVDGDNRKDLIYKRDGITRIRFLGDTGFGAEQSTNLTTALASDSTWVADFNGDGMDDLLVKHGSSYWDVYYAQGGTTFRQYIGDDDLDGFSMLKVMDFNGDGLPDLLLRHSGYIWVRINTGGEFAAQTQVISAVVGSTAWNNALVYDYNSDGQSDLLYRKDSKWRVLVSDGQSMTDEATNVDNDGWDNAPVVMDVSGNGLSDLVLSYSGNIHVRLHNNERPDYLKTVENGLGVETKFSYAFLNDPSQPAEFYELGDEALYPELTIQNASYLVSKVEQSNGVGGYNSSSYQYKRLLIHQLGLGNIGFEEMTVVNNDTGLKTTTVFDQDYDSHLHGTPVSVTTINTNLAEDEDISVTTNDWAVDLMCADGNGASCEDDPDDIDTTRYLRYVRETTVDKWDLDTSPLHREVITNPSTKDIYYGADSANRETISKVYSAGGSTLYRTKTTKVKYQNDTDDWLMGQITYSSVESDATTATGSALERLSTFTYDSTTGRKTAEMIHDPDNISTVFHKTEYGKDASGNTALSSYGQNEAITVSGLGFLSRTKEIDYSPDGRYVESETNALGHVVEYEYYSDSYGGGGRGGLLRYKTDANGLDTEYTYDAFGRILTTTAFHGTAKEVTNTTSYHACSPGVQECPGASSGYAASYYVKSLGDDGSESREYFDKLGRTVRKATVGFNASSTEWIFVDHRYNANGHNDRVSEPYKKGSGSIPWNEIVYDDMGRAVETTNANGRVDEVEYDGLKVTSYMDVAGKNQEKIEWRDPLGNLVKVTDNDNKVTEYEYDAFGKMTVVDPPSVSGHSVPNTTITYDILGRKTSMSDPDKGTWQYSYNGLGELITQTNAKGEVTCTAYDKLGRKVKRIDNYQGQVSQSTNQCSGDSSNPQTATWVYDTATGAGIGKLKTVTGANNYSKTFQYNSYGNVSSVTETIDSDTYTIETEYDNLHRVDVVTYPGPGYLVDIRHEYNSRGYLKELRNDDTNFLYYRIDGQDARGNITSEYHGNGVETDRLYNRYSGYIDTIQSGVLAVDNRQNLEFEFDKLGNLIERQDVLKGYEESFGYDSLNRLTNTTADFGNGQDQTTTVSYDALGNIRTKTGVGTYYYGNSYKCTGNQGPHAVCKIEGGSIGTKNTSYVYDANGNMVSGDGRSVTWSSFDKPTQITQSGNTTDMVYGPDRNLVMRVDNRGGSDTEAVFVGGLYEKVSLPGGTTKERHYIGNHTVLTLTNRTSSTAGSSEARYLHKDHLGSTTVITDENGNEVESFSFDPWGKRRAATLAELQSILGSWGTLSVYEKGNLTIPAYDLSSDTTNRGFTGHEQLDGVNLIHMGGRVYDAEIGRFLSADPFVDDKTNLQALNRYSYVQNNPLSYTDPSGYFLEKLVKDAVQSIGHAAEDLVEDILNVGKKFLREIGKIEGLSTAISTALYFIPGCGPYCSMAFNAAMAAANGGTIHQVATGAAVGFASGQLSNGFGHMMGGGDIANAGAAMLVGGSMAKAQGAKFIDGVKGAAAGAAIGYGISRIMSAVAEPANAEGASDRIGDGADSRFKTDENGERYFVDSDGNRAYPDRFLNKDGNPLLAMDLQDEIFLDKHLFGESKAGIMRCSPYVDCMKAVEAGYDPDIVDNSGWDENLGNNSAVYKKVWKFIRSPQVGAAIEVGKKFNADRICTAYAKNSGVNCN